MAQPKGSTGNPNGRPKGIPNKATTEARLAIAKFVDDHSSKISGWLDEIYRDEGAKDAFNCFTSLLEYHVPKLARNELTGKDGGAIEHKDVSESDAEILARYMK